MSTWDAFYGPNAGYAQELYERYLDDPQSVDPQTRAYFQSLGNGAGVAVLTPSTHAANGNGRAPSPPTTAPSPNGTALTRESIAKVVSAARLARSIREYGHLAADIDPLGGPRPGDPMLVPATHHITDADLAALPASIVWPSAGPEVGSCLDAIEGLRAIYCGPIGYEFDHVQDFDERSWLHTMVETGTYRRPLTPDEQRALLRRLTEVESFERFLHTVFVGQKRFSIEGTDTLVPMLDELLHDAREAGTREVLIGMAHRGRLNVLAHVLGKPYEGIFSEFHAANASAQPAHPGNSPGLASGWTGDVKYHLGASAVMGGESGLQVTLAHNPSHLEVVDPVVEGSTRAAQDDRAHGGAPAQDVDRAISVTIHGDAAFPGEGVVAETLNLSGLPGYTTGGTLRLIANNQIGFTTEPQSARSTLYASDLAKGFEIPVVHVNGDDPEACLAVVRLAHAYRQRFHKDFLIDLVGYRRWGHNEGDEPGFTQPLLYGTIGAHPTVRALYAQRLIDAGVISADDAEAMRREVTERLQRARDRLKAGPVDVGEGQEEHCLELTEIHTAVPAAELRSLNEALLARPEGFATNAKLERILNRRREALDREGGIDWGLAEALAFASILVDGHPIRLTGQDSERGTFGQRNIVLHDTRTGGVYDPMQALPQARASFAIYNSPLTETAVLGFEYGYSVHAPETLVLWEAQYGDFANVAQTIIDQFITAAQAKWRQRPSVTLLLPHGYEGQGPEHSSARLERYLQLAAENNIRIANPTTSGQYFHLLRLQAATLGREPRPLVVMTPKNLLRQARAASSLADLSEGRFHPVLVDTFAARDENVDRLVLCSGRVGIDLLAAADKAGEAADGMAIGRVELLFPFPAEELRALFQRFPNVGEVVWAQEEPRNMGAWTYMEPRLRELLPPDVPFRYAGRPPRAATAEGSPDAHAEQQTRIIDEAIGQLAPIGE